ncbi:MAG: GldG family protein [Alphaproteobacteria bacterium]
MGRYTSLLGFVGLVALVFGLVALWLTGEPTSLYVLFHLLVGVVLLLWFLVTRFRDLGHLLSARSTRHGANMVASSLLFVTLLAGLNWLGVRHNLRLDASESGAFSLSPQAKSVLDGIDGEVLLQAFLEGGHAPAVEDVLDSFQAGSSKVKVELVDPDKQPEVAEKYGVRSYGTVRVVHRTASCSDDGPRADESRAAAGDPPPPPCQSTTVSQPGEESLTNAVIKVSRQGKQAVCFVEGGGEPDPEDLEDPAGYGQARMALASENYDVKKVFLARDGKVPDDCNVLAFVGPQKPVTPEEAKALGDYLGLGGRALVMVSPGTADALKPVLATWGVDLGDDVVIDQVVDLFRGPQKVMDQYVSDYGEHPITKDLRDRSVLRFTRSVSPKDGLAGIRATTIARSSATSWAESDLPRLFQDSQAELDPEKDRKGPISLAVASEAKLKDEGKGDKDARLVVFGTAKLADNRGIGQFFNRDLFLNSVGWLGSQEELLSLRPRTVRASRVRFDATQATRIFYLSVLLLPELLMLAGLAVWWRRSNL